MSIESAVVAMCERNQKVEWEELTGMGMTGELNVDTSRLGFEAHTGAMAEQEFESEIRCR